MSIKSCFLRISLSFCCLFLILSCEQQEVQEPIGKYLSVSDFVLQLLEEPTIENQSLGTITTQTDAATSLEFELISQTPENAFEVDAFTGEITISDLTAFEIDVDTTTLTTVTGVVQVQTGQVLQKTVNVSITVGEESEELIEE